MTLRNRLILFSGSLVLTLLLVASLSLWSSSRFRKLHETQILGLELQVQSREVMSLMKDLVFELFSPKLYGHVRSLTYSPRSAVTLRQWEEAVDSYMMIFERFMESPALYPSRDRQLQDQYETATRMNRTALTKLARMKDILSSLQDTKKEDENLYNRMQKDETLIPFFNEIQETSYYFTNSFESFMNYFIRSYSEYGERLQIQTLVVNLVVTSLISAIAVALIIMISRDLLSKIGKMERAFSRVSQGDFSHPLNIVSNDELGELARRFDELSIDLKENVESILELTRNVGTAIREEIPEEGLRDLIVKAVIRDTAADAAGYYTAEQEGDLRLSCSAGYGKFSNFPLALADPDAHIANTAATTADTIIVRNTEEIPENFNSLPLSEHGIVSLIAIPLFRSGHCDGVLIATINEKGREFTDLGITRMITFSEFASLTIDHHSRYRELLEKGKAEYQALQSQVQPHFIYNVLSALFALNRQGEQDTLETSIIALRNMLRYVQDGRSETTIDEEIQFLRTYLELQKLRFGSRLNYVFNVPEDINRVTIPRLLFQPLVENAVIHGIEPIDHTGTVKIKCSWIYRDENRILEIEIADNGVGLPPEILEGGGRVGLPNVKARLQLTYPGSRFTVQTARNQGTKIRMEITTPRFQEANS